MSMTTRSAIPVTLGWILLLTACPFNNPYEYYGQSCSSDEQCDAPGLECVDGTCQGSGCTTSDDCAAPFDLCVAGRCQLKGASDAATTDLTSVDTGGRDAGVNDLASVDRAGTDAMSRDLVNTDTTGTDTSGTDVLVVTDSGSLDRTSQDTVSSTDGAVSDSAGGWDSAGATSCGSGQDCPAGFRCITDFCRPVLCDQNTDCVSPDFVCVKANPSSTWSGLCAPESCTSDATCEHALLTCDTSTFNCVHRRGGPYSTCVPEPGGQSWCGDGLECFVPFEGATGWCLQGCGPNVPCASDFLCLGMGFDGSLSSSNQGICVARCGAGLTLPADPLPGEVGPVCSHPDPAVSGVLTFIPSAFVGISCTGPQDCGGPLVCTRFYDDSQFCLLAPEALMWQALGEASIVTAIDGGSTVCGGGLYPVTGPGGPTLCLPRCQSENDCRFAIPPGANPACDFPVGHPAEPGFCSVSGPYSTSQGTSCFRPDLDPNNNCLIRTGINDGDGDGYFSGVDQCPTVPGPMGGCPDWPCRTSLECPSTHYCVGGTCGSPNQFCATSCPSNTQVVSSPICTGGTLLCVPSKGRDIPSPFCVDDGECTTANCSGPNGCVCVANACVPKHTAGTCSLPPYHGACLGPEAVMNLSISCQDNADCPQGASCDSGDKRCFVRGGGPPLCMTDDDCQPSAHCVAGLCAESGTELGCPDRFLGDACLECDLVNGVDAVWTLRESATASRCPCGMWQENAHCYGKRVLCPSQQDSECRSGFVCRAGRCVESEDVQGNCPPWHASVLGACASCLDTTGEPPSWDLPCYASNDPACPCGLLCLPDSAGNGSCTAQSDAIECMFGLSDGEACQGDGVWLEGRCWRLNRCIQNQDCEQGSFCIQSGTVEGFCAPQSSVTCSTPGLTCGTNWAGICVQQTGLTFCTPRALVPVGKPVATCNGMLGFCGPTCVCMGSAAPFNPTALIPRDCESGLFGLGEFCGSRTSLPTDASLVTGQRCSAGLWPGIADTNHSCVPTGQGLSPGCGPSLTCATDSRCQVGGCLPTCNTDTECHPVTANSSCLPFTVGTVTSKTCRLKPVTPSSGGCSRSSPYCAYFGVPEGGLCIEDGGGNGLCYPRVGCDLTQPGEICLDGAPVPLAGLTGEPGCVPWRLERCSLSGADCAGGRCHISDVEGSVCGLGRGCTSWLECPAGQLCQANSCAPYLADAANRATGAPCDGRPYGRGVTDGVLWEPLQGPALCLLKGDPRCGGRAVGQTCDAIYRDDDRGYNEVAVCSSQGACMSTDQLEGCDPSVGACTTGAGIAGNCRGTPRGPRCVP
ncbi:MAG: hypothetical protein ABIJ09_10285 [Pseudomonadota bacterium]